MVPPDLTPRYTRLPSPALGRPVHLWQYGHFGAPMIAFPTAGGYAHEWQQQGMVEALGPLLRAGRLKLYQPETNICRTWNTVGDPVERLARHHSYEAFVMNTLLPHIEADCATPGIRIGLIGASLGALYATNLALKHPETFDRAVCLSGRYATQAFLGRHTGLDAYYNTPLDYVWNLSGDPLTRIQKHTHITLVVGRGAHEGRCVTETVALARAFTQVGIPHHLDMWGPEAAHTWPWWHRQARLHLTHQAA